MPLTGYLIYFLFPPTSKYCKNTNVTQGKKTTKRDVMRKSSTTGRPNFCLNSCVTEQELRDRISMSQIARSAFAAFLLSDSRTEMSAKRHLAVEIDTTWQSKKLKKAAGMKTTADGRTHWWPSSLPYRDWPWWRPCWNVSFLLHTHDSRGWCPQDTGWTTGGRLHVNWQQQQESFPLGTGRRRQQ